MTHRFEGPPVGGTCRLIVEANDEPAHYCALPPDHPTHTGLCVHCHQVLDPSKGDGEEACRFCHPHYSQAPANRRCLACLHGSWH